MRIKLISVLLVIALLFMQPVFARDISRPELVNLANQELIAKQILKMTYFGEKNVADKSLSSSPYLSGIRNLIVYGNPHGQAGDRNRYLGYTMSNAPFTNYLFPNDSISSRPLWDRNWIENPYRDSPTKNRPEVQGDGYFNNNPDFEESIRKGLAKISRTNPVDFPEDKLKGRQWHRYVHVYQPPTSVSWGSGIMFHESGGRIFYLTVPMSPDGIEPPKDLSTEFEAIPTAAPEGSNVLVSIKVKSTFEEAVDTEYAWNITGVPSADITYRGHGARDPVSNRGYRLGQ